LTGFVLSLVQLAAGVTVMHAPCPAYAAPTSCYVPETRTVYMTPRDERSRFALLHEYGHAWDFIKLTDAQRDRAKRLLGYSSSRDWWHWSPVSGTPGEAFADAYAYCAMGRWPYWVGTGYRRVCSLLPRSAFANLIARVGR
jgi:hypothetical protein